MRWRAAGAATILVAMAGAAIVSGASPAGAAAAVTLFVSTAGTATSGCTAPAPGHACATLQEALTAAETTHTGAAVTVHVAAGHYPDTAAVVTDTGLASLTVVGAGSTPATGSVLEGPVTLDALHVPIVKVAPGSSVTATDLVFTDGTAARGGGLDNLGDAVLRDDAFLHDDAGFGGAIFNDGTLTMRGGVIRTGHAGFAGGGIFDGELLIAGPILREAGTSSAGGLVHSMTSLPGGVGATLTGVVIEGTSATNAGGAILSTLARLTVSSSSVLDDRVASGGGGAGVMSRGSTVTLSHDTFAGDVAPAGTGPFRGGAVSAVRGFESSSGHLTITDDTFTTDHAAPGADLFDEGVPVAAVDDTFAGGTSLGVLVTAASGWVRDSIVEGTSCAVSPAVAATSGFDVATTPSCALGHHSVVTTAAALGLAPALAPNTSHGPETLAIGPTSAAYGEVPVTACVLPTDERGFPRPGAGRTGSCDAGAYEYQAGAATTAIGRTVAVRRVDGATADATAARELASAFAGTCPGTAGDRPVVLDGDRAFSDGPPSAYLAKDLSTGILLTPAGSLSVPTETALRVLGVTHVYVVGGPGAVSTAVVAALERTPAYGCGGTARRGRDLQVTRIAGATAVATAARVAAFPGAGFVGRADLAGAYAGTGRYDTTSGASSPAPSSAGALRTAVVAPAGTVEDAEAGAVLSYAEDLPFLYGAQGTVPAATRQALVSLGIRQVVLLGGPLAFSTAVVASLQAEGVSVLRVAGAGTSGTAVELAMLETGPPDQGFGWDGRTLAGLAVAQGGAPAGAVGGAVLAARGLEGTGPVPLLFTESPTAVGQDLAAFLHHVGDQGIGSPPRPVSRLFVFGGPGAVSPPVVQAMVGELEGMGHVPGQSPAP